MRSVSILLSLCLITASCGSETNVEEARPSVENAYSTQLDSLEKAKRVEQQLKENAKQRKQEIEQKTN